MIELPFKIPAVIVDLETTGGSAEKSRIIEIAVIRIEPGRKPISYSSLLNPHQPIPWFVQQMTGITPDLVADSPVFSDILGTLKLLFKDALFIAHNAPFDFSFLYEEYQRVGLEFSLPLLCSARFSKRLYPQYRRHNLSELIVRHGLSVKDRHRAMGDARAVFDFLKLAAEEKGMEVFEKTVQESVKLPGKKKQRT